MTPFSSPVRMAFGSLVLALVAAGCGGEGGTAAACGPGEVLQDDVCVAAPPRPRRGAGDVDAGDDRSSEAATHDDSSGRPGEGEHDTDRSGEASTGRGSGTGEERPTPACTPGEFRGCAGEAAARRCTSDGTAVVPEACPAEAPFCIEGMGCRPNRCEPGVTRQCLDGVTVGVCAADGSGFEPAESCGEGVCVAPGVCSSLDACGENEKEPSYLGCEYWAVDLPQDRGLAQGGNQAGGAEAEDWAVIVSNPGAVAAQVTVFAATSLQTPIRDVTVEPGSIEIIVMPRADLYATSITRRSFRIVSSQPVAMHQFNPLDNVNVQSNDASLLFPVNALTGSYRLLSYRTRVTWYASATVIAVAPGLTQVTVVSPDRINSPEGGETSEDGVMAGWDDRNPRSFTLEQGQVLHLSSRSLTDLTGLSVEADQPVAVFSSAAGIYVPVARGTSDHIEHQMLPIEAWRDRYIGVPFRQRGTVADHFRVGAGPEGARVSLSIPVNGQGWNNGEITLQPDGWTEFAATQPFELVSDHPVQVGHFMAGSQADGVPTRCTSGSRQLGLGDPSLTVLVPEEQWREDYTIFTPNGYEEDWFTLVGPRDAVVQITDDAGNVASVTLTTPIPSTTLAFAYHALPRNAAGTGTRSNIHTLRSTAPFGVEAYGWSCAVSYAYPGGLNLRSLTDPD